jgi:outer membrane protein assembly factor BamB
MHRSTLAALVFLAVPPAAARAADWPQFRGPDGQGHSTAQGVPLAWSETENITWKTAVPGHGWSSPSIQGSQIWLTSATEDNHSLRAYCIDRGSGRIVHDVEVFHLDDPGSIHANNSQASPTPAIDADGVYVHYGAHGTACLSTDGRIEWKTKLDYNHGHGPAGSPVICGDLVVISCDGTDVQYVVALDKKTGQTRWKHDRQHISDARRKGELEAPMAYCTPLVLELGGQQQVVSLGSDAVVAYEPASGQELWWFSFSGYSNVSRPVYGQGLLFFSSGFGTPTFYAARVPGDGDLTESGKVWTSTKSGLVPLDVSPLLVGNELYTITDSGIGVCYDAATGKQHWTSRLGGKFWASPVYADGRIYCTDEQATTTVFRPGTRFERLAVNKLPGNAQASPAIVDGAIFLRTDTHLYRIDNAGVAAAR